MSDPRDGTIALLRDALGDIYGTVNLTLARAREIAHLALEETDGGVVRAAPREPSPEAINAAYWQLVDPNAKGGAWDGRPTMNERTIAALRAAYAVDGLNRAPDVSGNAVSDKELGVGGERAAGEGP